MIDLPSLPVIHRLDVSSLARLFEKAHHQGALVAVGEVIELAAQEIAGVDRHQVQERGLALGITERLKRCDGIACHGQSSRMRSMRRWSPSIFAVSVARSEGEA